MRLLGWPPYEAAFNPIENVWGTMRSNLAHLNLNTATADHLWLVVQAEWEALRQTLGYAEELNTSLPQKTKDAIRVYGAFTTH